MEENVTWREFVAGDGWISDDSSFYGDEGEQENLEAMSAAFDVSASVQLKYHSSIVTNIAAQAQRKEQMTSATSAPMDNSFDHARDTKVSDQDLSMLDCVERGDGEQTNAANSSKQKSSNAASIHSTVEHNYFNPWEGQEHHARQLGESVTQFLRRIPVQTATIDEVRDFWIWIANPHGSPRESPQDVDEMVEDGNLLLALYQSDAAEVESTNKGKSQHDITRKLTPLREKLQNDIEALGKETHVLTGKWMLFPDEADLPRFWRLVAEGTIDNRLGCSAKVATITPDTDVTKPRLICVYTKNFADFDDVLRVLHELVELGLANGEKGRGIYYKTDAYTHLDINSNNPYGLRASKYGSKQLLSTGISQTRTAEKVRKPQKRQTTLGDFQRKFMK